MLHNIYSKQDLSKLWKLWKMSGAFVSHKVALKSNMCSCSTEAVISSSYICSNNQKHMLWLKIIDFYFMPKIIRIMFHEDI